MSNHIEKILNLLSEKDYKPVSDAGLKKRLGIKRHQMKGFYKDLKKLRRQGKINRIGKNMYVLASKESNINNLSGILRKKEGYFFLQTQSGDYRLPRLINPFRAVAGDEVVASLERRKYGFVAVIRKVIKRKYKNIIGKSYKKEKSWIVEPVDRKVGYGLEISDADKHALFDGCVVLCEIAEYPTLKKRAKGRILKIYGDEHNSSIDEEVVIDKYNLPHVFDENVQKQLGLIHKPNEDNFKGRVDLRKLYTITIDGESAKDFDDAIDIEKIKKGFKLFVHIADVSNYVKQNSPIDKEAFIRGFSVYFPKSVIPMLPEKLSDNICSLVPDKDRLTISVIMDIDEKGNIKDYKFVKSVIRNKKRMTYKQVETILSNKTACEDNLKEKLTTMKALATILRKKRFRNGSIDLNIPEAEFELDDEKIVDIREKRNLFSYSLIEEFMLAANLCAADILSKYFDVFIRRIHEEPDLKKISQLTLFLKRFGIKYSFDKSKIKSSDIQKLLESIKDEKKKKIVSYLVLRSLKRAEYSVENKGHYALGFENYTHFTSPIRRYCDLTIHRMIGSIIEKKHIDVEGLEFIAAGIRDREIVTEEAQFYMNDVASAAFMSRYVGQKFTGTIVSLISSGMFVRLDRYFVEGFVAAERMDDDYYEYFEELFIMIGRRKKKVYKIGDSVDVVVVSVNKFAAEIDFILA